MPGLPAGVKFDPTDQEILEHLKAKVGCDTNELHPLIDEFIPTIEGETGICYTHPEKLPSKFQYQSYPWIEFYWLLNRKWDRSIFYNRWHIKEPT